MFHPDRRFTIIPVEHPEVLARKLTREKWTIFTGFKHGRHLILNDSYSDEHAQDYAVLIDEPDAEGQYVQVNGFPFGWMDTAEALRVIREISRGAYDGAMVGRHELRLEQR